MTHANSKFFSRKFIFSVCPIICNILTIDLLSNFTNPNTANAFTGFTVYNIQITYQKIDFGEEVQNMISPIPNFFS